MVNEDWNGACGGRSVSSGQCVCGGRYVCVCGWLRRPNTCC